MNLQTFTSTLDSLSNKELIDRFNQEVGNSGWTCSRGAFLVALSRQFAKRGIDFSSIGDQISLSLKNKIHLEGRIILVSKA